MGADAVDRRLTRPIPPQSEGGGAIRFVSAALRMGGVSGGILLGGDSTVAFRADRKKEMTLKKLGRDTETMPRC